MQFDNVNTDWRGMRLGMKFIEITKSRMNNQLIKKLIIFAEWSYVLSKVPGSEKSSSYSWRMEATKSNGML